MKNRYGHELRLEWDCLIQIYQKLLPYLEQQQNTSFADIFTETITWTAGLKNKIKSNQINNANKQAN